MLQGNNSCETPVVILYFRWICYFKLLPKLRLSICINKTQGGNVTYRNFFFDLLNEVLELVRKC